MRIAVAGIFHETNTFVAETTSLADFQSYHLAYGSEVLAFGRTQFEMGGFLAGCEELGWDAVPSVFASALPGGKVEGGAFEALVQRLVEGTVAEGRPDGVLICLHGAMVAGDYLDADGEVLRRLSEAVGPDVPIVATLDFHSNTSDLMTSSVHALVGYDTYPHIDMYDRGREAVSVLAGVLRDDQRRSTVHRKVDLITPPQVQYTDLPTMRAIFDAAHSVEASGDVLATVTPGFAYADSDCLGLSVVTSSADSASALQAAELVVGEVRRRVEEFTFDAFSVEEAVERALGAEGPVVLVDSADNVGGGGPGDGTAILAEWLRRGGLGLVIALSDPVAVAAAMAAGVGSRVSLSVGGHTDDRHGTPLDLLVTVRLLSDGRFTYRGSYASGLSVQMGNTAVVDCAGNTIILSERRVVPFDAGQLLSVGVSPEHCQALVVKSAVAWRAGFERFARTVIEVDSPGVCTANLHRLDLSKSYSAMIRPQSVQHSDQLERARPSAS